MKTFLKILVAIPLTIIWLGVCATSFDDPILVLVIFFASLILLSMLLKGAKDDQSIS